MEEDVIELDPEDFGDTPVTEEVEQTSETEKEVETPSETKETNVDENQLLAYLNSKGIKYNGENVNIKNVDELLSTYQKGLNYDKVKQRAEQNEDDVEALEYIKEKAGILNLTTRDYIARVRDFEKRQDAQKVEDDIRELIEKGVDEETAKRVAENESRMKEFEKVKHELDERLAAQKQEELKNAEFEEFIKAYPELDYQSIPKEVFEANKNGTTLLNAYREFENKQLKEKIKQMEQNIKNASSSVVTPTSEGSTTEQMSQDEFLQGFDSVL